MKSLNNVQNICMRFVAAEASHRKANCKVYRYSCPVLVKGSYDISQFIIIIIISLARMKQSTANWHCTFKSPQIRPLSQTLSTRALLVRCQVSLAPLRAMEGILTVNPTIPGKRRGSLLNRTSYLWQTNHQDMSSWSNLPVTVQEMWCFGGSKKWKHIMQKIQIGTYLPMVIWKKFLTNLCFQARNLNTYLVQSLGSWWQSSGKRYWTSCPLALSKICRIYSNFNN